MTSDRVFIRVRGGPDQGWGHVVRAAAIHAHLERVMPELHVSVFAQGDAAVLAYLAARVGDLVPLEAEPDEAEERALGARRGRARLALIDMLGAGPAIQRAWREHADHVVLVNELCDVEHVADTVVCAQLLEAPPTLDSSRGVRYLTGLEHFILPDAFRLAAEERHPPRAPARSLLVLIGGGVYEQAERRIARALAAGAGGWERLVFVTGYAASPEHRRSLAETLPAAQVLAGTDRVARLGAEADLALISGGYSKYELACLGTPSLMLAVQEHQRSIARAFAATGAARYLGHVEELDEKMIRDAIGVLAEDRLALTSMARAALRLMDGRGLERVLGAVLTGYPLELATVRG